MAGCVPGSAKGHSTVCPTSCLRVVNSVMVDSPHHFICWEVSCLLRSGAVRNAAVVDRYSTSPRQSWPEHCTCTPPSRPREQPGALPARSPQGGLSFTTALHDIPEGAVALWLSTFGGACVWFRAMCKPGPSLSASTDSRERPMRPEVRAGEKVALQGREPWVSGPLL